MGITALNSINPQLVPEINRKAGRIFDRVALGAQELAETDASGFPAGFRKPYRHQSLRKRLVKWALRVCCRLRLRGTRPAYNWHDVRSVLANHVKNTCGSSSLHLGHELVAVRTEEAGVDLVFTIRPDCEEGSVSKATSVKYRARLVCSADGVRSMTRRCWPGADTATNKPQGQSVWYGLAPRLHLKDCMVRSVAHEGCLIFVVPTYRGRGASCSFLAPAVSGHATSSADATARCLSAMPRELRPVLLPLLNSTTQLSETKMWSRDFSRAWHSQSRQLCFLGDAAHPMCSTFGYGTSLAFEDAVVLARVAASAGSLDSFRD